MIEIAKLKSLLSDLVKKYKQVEVLSDTFCKDFENSFNDENLIIGVIGKMKAGKSSLVNALVFGDNILPTGSKPVTVSLTEITYGETDSVEVQLLSSDDIASLRSIASLGSEKSKPAKEILEQIDSIQGGYDHLVSQDKYSITLSELNNYVAVGGKFSGLVKCVKIQLNNPNLKGITIIDTPGFNDPVSSRCATTAQALHNCHILLFVHHTFDMYDNTEMSILKEQIGFAGISEVVDVINKIDLLTDYDIDHWNDYVAVFNKHKSKAISQIGSTDLQNILSASVTIPVSPLMALLGQIDDSQFTSNMKNDYVDFQTDFEQINSKDDFVKFSNIVSLTKIINEFAQNKSQYLCQSPLRTLKGQLELGATEVNVKIEAAKDTYKLLIKSRDNAKTKKKEIDNYFNDVLVKITASSISKELDSLITEEESLLHQLRRDKSANQFTPSVYNEPTPTSRGIKKRNLSFYVLFISEFENLLRDELWALRNNFKSTIESVVNDIMQYLLTNNVDEDMRNAFKNALLVAVNKVLSEISIVVCVERQKTPLSGNQLQYTLYKNKFEEVFNDKVIQVFLLPFKDACNNVLETLESTSKEELCKIRDKIKQLINANPDQQQNLISGLEADIQRLETLKDDLLIDIRNLDQYVK